MSLLKIPAVFLTAWSYKRSFTNPNPPPPASELNKPVTVVEGRWLLQNGPKIIVMVTLLTSLLEIMTILSAPVANTHAVLSQPNPLWSPPCKDPNALSLSPMTAIGVLLMVSGALLRTWCYTTLGSFFRFEASIQKNHKLVTVGPYALCRHPSYTGMVLLHAGWFLWVLGRGSWLRECGALEVGRLSLSEYAAGWPAGWVLECMSVGWLIFAGYATFSSLIPLYLLLSRMRGEDEALRREFGVIWDEYAKKVPFVLLPGIY